MPLGTTASSLLNEMLTVDHEVSICNFGQEPESLGSVYIRQLVE